MKVIQNKFIPFKGYKYINIFGLIFTRDKSKITDIEYNHEKMDIGWFLFLSEDGWYC